jgi:hypothetical protein
MPVVELQNRRTAHAGENWRIEETKAELVGGMKIMTKGE